MSTLVWASHASLFDRLCAPPSVAPSPHRLQEDDLRASLARDLERLLNTRNGLTVEQARTREACVLSYGLPDVQALDLRVDGGLQVLAEVVQRAITQFEPRLRDVAVQAQPEARSADRVRLVIAATARSGRQVQRVEFEIVADAVGTMYGGVA